MEVGVKTLVCVGGRVMGAGGWQWVEAGGTHTRLLTRSLAVHIKTPNTRPLHVLHPPTHLTITYTHPPTFTSLLQTKVLTLLSFLTYTLFLPLLSLHIRTLHIPRFLFCSNLTLPAHLSSFTSLSHFIFFFYTPINCLSFGLLLLPFLHLLTITIILRPTLASVLFIALFAPFNGLQPVQLFFSKGTVWVFKIREGRVLLLFMIIHIEYCKNITHTAS